MTSHHVPSDLISTCCLYSLSTVTIHVASFGRLRASYIKIPELYEEKSLIEFDPNSVWQFGFVALENRFGTVLTTCHFMLSNTGNIFGPDTAPPNTYFNFMNSLKEDCILVIATQGRGIMPFSLRGYLSKYCDIRCWPDSNVSDGFMFVGSTNGWRKWMDGAFDIMKYDGHSTGTYSEMVVTVPLMS